MVLLGNHGSTDSEQRVRHVVTAAAASNRYHPLHEYLDGLQWDSDGPSAIDKLAGHFTATDQAVFNSWLRKWLVGAVARWYGGEPMPVLVLDGPQDAGKSWFVRWLASAFKIPGIETPYRETIPDPEHKDSRIALATTPLWELGEIDQFTSKKAATAIKNFLTLRTVSDRRPYSRYDTVKVALSTFIGTFNDNGGYLTDSTGNRRFLTVEIEKIDWAYSDMPASLVWAEAVHLYRTEFDKWQFTAQDKSIRDHRNETYRIIDPVEDAVNERVTFTGIETDFVSSSNLTGEVATVLGQPNNSGLGRKVAGAVKQIGGVKSKAKVNGKEIRGFRGIKM
jgi:predicted P-loop ATPase